MRPKNKGALINCLYRFFFFALFSFFAAVPPVGVADEQPSAENGSGERDSYGLPEFRIGVRVDLVLLYASVVDKNNHFIPGLERNRFRVFEDGVEQNMESFAQESVPVSMGVVLDLSGSMRGKIEQVNRAALAFLQAGNPGDEFFLIGFNDEVELLRDYTGDIDEISDALENTVVAGKTHLYDAVYLGVEKAHAGTRSKKALVVITDGNDDTSFYSLKELISKIQESDVQVYCVGLLDDMPKKGIFGRWLNSESKKYHDALVRISEETGGNAFFPQEAPEIRGIVEEIARDLRSQYSIGYFSSNNARDGAFRTVKIELIDKKTDGIKIRHRRGYYAPAQYNSMKYPD
ncbi:MAG: VWA domain-containing protein [Acidobacteriota bacterium]|jgi:VWFA-related protein|nr:VWA domain-containing protein [Acidobacteriota bacterium]